MPIGLFSNHSRMYECIIFPSGGILLGSNLSVISATETMSWVSDDDTFHHWIPPKLYANQILAYYCLLFLLELLSHLIHALLVELAMCHICLSY